MKKVILLIVILLPLVFGGCVSHVISNNVSVYGFVYDAETNELLQNVHLTLLPPSVSCHTGDDGYYHFNNVEWSENGYVITAKKNGYVANTRNFSIGAANVAEVNLFMTKTNKE